MLRDKNLIPMSHQHQHALALCVRIDRASPVPETDLQAWQSEITQHFRTEIAVHFSAEEKVLFPIARRFEELLLLVEDLLADHAYLREKFAAAEANRLSAMELTEFAQRLSAHIRKEERELFEQMQALLSAEELRSLGQQLEQALKEATDTCILPSNATRLRPM
jgi:hemerythrin-like domain-containing protein